MDTERNTNSLRDWNISRSFQKVVWQWRTFLADVEKDIEGRFESGDQLGQSKAFLEQGKGNKASQVGRGHIVEGFPHQDEDP